MGVAYSVPTNTTATTARQPLPQYQMPGQPISEQFLPNYHQFVKLGMNTTWRVFSLPLEICVWVGERALTFHAAQTGLGKAPWETTNYLLSYTYNLYVSLFVLFNLFSISSLCRHPSCALSSRWTPNKGVWPDVSHCFTPVRWQMTDSL